MTLRKQFVVTVFGLGFILLFLFYFIMTQTIEKKYLAIEREELIVNTQRAYDALHDRMEALHVKSSDWANWDDTYKYIQNPNKEYEQSNLQQPSLADLKISFLYMANIKGAEVVNVILEKEKTGWVNSGAKLIDWVKKNKYFYLNPKEFDDGVIDLFSDGLDIYMVSIRPILTSNLNGPTAGTIIFAQKITANLLEEISNSLHLPVTLEQWSDYEKEKGSPSFEGAIWVRAESSKKAIGAYRIDDNEKKPLGVLKAESHRKMFGQLISTNIFFVVSLLVFLILFSLFMLLFINMSVMSHILNFNHMIVETTKSIEAGDCNFSSVKLNHQKDEIGILHNSINSMKDVLKNILTKK